MSLTIIKEGNPILRVKSKNVKLPLIDEDINTINLMMTHLMKSQIPEIAEEEELQPGVGIAAPQIGVSKNIFCMFASDFDDKLHKYAFINPIIVKKSKELVYLPDGEGCLSVSREVEGVVLRHEEISVKTYLYDFEKKKVFRKLLKLTGIISTIFQHEYDHLDGILFVDRLIDINELPNLASSLIVEIDESEEKTSE